MIKANKNIFCIDDYFKNASPVRRITDSSLVYLQQDTQEYPCFDIATKLVADVLYARWDDMEFVYSGGKPNITEKKLTNFIERMGLVDTKGRDLIDTKLSCLEDREICVPVRKISQLEKEIAGEDLIENQYNNITIKNICKRTDTNKEKIETIDYIDPSCQCIRFNYQKICRAPKDQRILFNDSRTRLSIPSPYVRPFDLHISMGMNYSALHLDSYDMEVYGYPDFVVQAEKEMIQKMTDLKVNKNWPLYRISWAFQDFGKRVFNPLIMTAQTGLMQ